MAWPNELSSDQRLDDAAGRLQVIAERVKVAIHLYENNQKFVFDRDFDSKVPTSYARAMLQFLQHTLVKSLTLEILKIWDSVGRHRDSLPTIVALINRPEIIDRQRERQLANSKAHRYFSGDMEMLDWMIEVSDKQAEEVADERHGKLTQVLVDVDAYFNDNPLLTRMRDYRDRHIAHSLSTKQKVTDLPFYKDAHELLFASQPLVNTLLECVCYGTQPWQEFHDIAASQANDLWNGATFAIQDAG